MYGLEMSVATRDMLGLPGWSEWLRMRGVPIQCSLDGWVEADHDFDVLQGRPLQILGSRVPGPGRETA